MTNQTIAKQMSSRRLNLAGFTLVELMITVVVVSILMSIAIPAYNAQIRKGRRTEAKTALLDLAGREERYFNTNNTYTNMAANLGYAPAGSTTTVTNLAVGSGYYQVTASSPAANGVAAPSYEVTATPRTPDQQNDTQCQWFSVDSTGKQLANTQNGGGGTDTSSTCW
jgi:type IV pilus assembly protein PilE